MWSKIKTLLAQPTTKTSSELVSLMCHLIHNTGFSSYLKIRKMHWIATIATACFVFTFCLQIIALFMARNDADRLFECFSVLSFCGMGIFKLMSLRNCYQDWRYLFTQIVSLESDELNGTFCSPVEYDSDNEDDDNFNGHIKNYTNQFKTISTILSRMYSFTAVVFIFSPFLEYMLCEIREVECLEYPHILPDWAPLDNISFFGYMLTVLAEFVASVYCVCVHIAFDLSAVGVMIFLCGQFSLLRDYSSKIGGKGNNCNYSTKRDVRAHYRIVHCHRTHIILLESIKKLNKLVQHIIGLYFFVATLTLCSVAVRLKYEDMSIMQLATLLQYMCATLTQLFLFCRFGDAVSNESSVSMGQGPFAAAYWCLTPRTKQLLLILGAGMMQQQYLRAGPFNRLDLPSLIQVVRAAYSYYAVLAKK